MTLHGVHCIHAGLESKKKTVRALIGPLEFLECSLGGSKGFNGSLND